MENEIYIPPVINKKSGKGWRAESGGGRESIDHNERTNELSRVRIKQKAKYAICNKTFFARERANGVMDRCKGRVLGAG